MLGGSSVTKVYGTNYIVQNFLVSGGYRAVTS